MKNIEEDSEDAEELSISESSPKGIHILIFRRLCKAKGQ
jgi:hypothetical protein